MKKYLIIIFTFFIGFALCACKESPQSRSTETATQTSLPLSFNTGNIAPYGLPSTVITIENKQIPVILDSGEKTTAIDLSLAAIKNLHIRFTGQQDCFQASDGKHCEQIFIIPQVKVGSFTVDNVKGRLMTQTLGANDPIFKATDASNNGLIGFALFSQFNVLLDFPHATMTLVKPGNQPTGYDMKNWVVIPFNGHLQSSLLLNGIPMTVTWDTGAIPSLINKSMASNFAASPCPGDAPYSKYNCFSIIPKSLITNNNQELSATWFKIKDNAAEAPVDAVLGSNFYQENLVYFDFDKKLVYVKKI